MARKTVSLPRPNEIAKRTGTEIQTESETGRKRRIGIEMLKGEGREVEVQVQTGDPIVGTETIEIATGIGTETRNEMKIESGKKA
jgi:hypothetical protein